ncbi:MAG: hypothetical protein IKP39_00225 [Paludibacteraceae bacterium]|nr:hypothetical protein [Paludibacteraceae bacterium]
MKRILLLFMTLLSIAGADACKHKTYKIDFSGQEYAYAESKVESQKSKAESKDPWLSEQGLKPARADTRRARKWCCISRW